MDLGPLEVQSTKTKPWTSITGDGDLQSPSGMLRRAQGRPENVRIKKLIRSILRRRAWIGKGTDQCAANPSGSHVGVEYKRKQSSTPELSDSDASSTLRLYVLTYVFAASVLYYCSVPAPVNLKSSLKKIQLRLIQPLIPVVH